MSMIPAVLVAMMLQQAPPVLVAPPEVVARAGVNRTLDRLHEAASQANGPVYFALFTPDARFIGTDATERWSLAEFKAYAEPFFARGQGWTYAPRDRVVTFAPVECRCVAAFDEVLDNASYGSVRGSGVLVETESGWKIEQYVLSYAIPNDVARTVTGLIREHEATVATPAATPDR